MKTTQFAKRVAKIVKKLGMLSSRYGVAVEASKKANEAYEQARREFRRFEIMVGNIENSKWAGDWEDVIDDLIGQLCTMEDDLYELHEVQMEAASKVEHLDCIIEDIANEVEYV